MSAEFPLLVRYIVREDPAQLGSQLLARLDALQAIAPLGRYNATLKLIEGWKEEEEESAADYVFMVSLTYNTLSKLLTEKAAKDNAAERYLRFLELKYDVTGKRNVWFSSVQMMFNDLKFTDNPLEHSRLLSHLTRSANPIISLYAEIEALKSADR